MRIWNCSRRPFYIKIQMFYVCHPEAKNLIIALSRRSIKTQFADNK